MGLYRKFTLLSVSLAALVIAFSSWQNYRCMKAQIKETQREKVDLLSEVIGNGLKTTMLEGRGREFQKFLDTLIAEDIAAVRIYTQNGTIFSSSIPGEVGKNISGSRHPDPGGRSGVPVGSGAEDREVYSKSVLIRNDQLCRKCHGEGEGINGILDVEMFTHETDRLIARRTGSIALLGLASVSVLAIALGMLGSRCLKRPLDDIAAAARRAAGGDLSARAPAQEAVELATLSADLNSIISDLGRLYEERDRCMVDKNMYVERMASLGELAAAVAHDIKNPLAGISGALQVLAEDFPEESPRKEIAREVLSEIGRLDAAVKDLLIYARPPDLNLILTDINAIIEKVSRRLQPQAEELEVRIDVVPEELKETVADPEQMERALTNIALYCMQNMKGGGILTFSTRRMDDSGEVEIALSDTSGGMGRGPYADVFKPSFSTKHTGTGLGMAISRSIVEGHKGRIDVESIPGKGSTFRIVLKQKG